MGRNGSSGNLAKKAIVKPPRIPNSINRLNLQSADPRQASRGRGRGVRKYQQHSYGQG